MRDGPARRALKAVALVNFALNVGARRGLARLRGRRFHTLAGACRSCARCCEAPSVRANRLVFHARSLRAAFLAWMKHVNGFELVRAERRTRTFVFRCTHFDWQTRRCDSYASRPGMCRDYPRLLLEQPAPELFPECGYRARPRNAAALAREIARQPLAPEQRERLQRRLGLD